MRGRPPLLGAVQHSDGTGVAQEAQQEDHGAPHPVHDADAPGDT